MSASGSSSGSRVPGAESTREAVIGAAGGAVGTIGAAAVVGLEKASAMAGEVLRGIFGAVPWELSWSEIVSAVGGKGAALVPEVLGHL